MSKIIKIPGLIDVHVHLREPGATQKEDFESGTKAAIAGGYTTILDMPNNPVATVSLEALENKIKLAQGRIYCDLGFHFGAAPKNSYEFEKVKNKVFGLKLYMNHTTGDLLMENDQDLENVFKNWIKGKPLMVHAEGDTLKKAINLAKKFNQRLHVCHISLKSEIEQIKLAKIDGLDISCEVSCHHLFLADTDVQRLGSYGMMKPPLSSESNRQALWDNLEYIDMVASDHAPHTKSEKETPGKVVNGVPGLETSLPLLLTAVAEEKLTINRLIEMTSTNPRKIFNIPEQPDTYVEVDTTIRYTLNANNLFTKCKWTPFEGMKVKGKVKKVTLRGKVVFENGKVFRPFGQTILPNKNG